MKIRLLSVFSALLSISVLADCDRESDQVVVVDRQESRRPFEKLGSTDVCYAEVGATLTVVQTHHAVGGGCGATRQPDYFLDYSTDGSRDFRDKYGRPSTPDAQTRPRCAEHDILLADRDRYDALREQYKLFLRRQKETER